MPKKKSNNGTNGKISKTTIVHFRITPDQEKALNERLKDVPVVGISSGNQLARKILVDTLSGRLTYKRKDDAFVDPDLYANA